MPFECVQPLDALLHQADVSIQQVVHLPAGLKRRCREFQQLTHFEQRDIQRPEVPDETQPRNMPLVVVAIARRVARRLLEQTFALVEPHGLHVAAGLGSKLTDLHQSPTG